MGAGRQHSRPGPDHPPSGLLGGLVVPPGRALAPALPARRMGEGKPDRRDDARAGQDRAREPPRDDQPPAEPVVRAGCRRQYIRGARRGVERRSGVERLVEDGFRDHAQRTVPRLRGMERLRFPHRAGRRRGRGPARVHRLLFALGLRWVEPGVARLPAPARAGQRGTIGGFTLVPTPVPAQPRRARDPPRALQLLGSDHLLGERAGPAPPG